MNPKILAFYLPQFHPIQENDEWWGKGFTEWTNVGRAKPLWKGHKQPRVPADLGYYDLRIPDVREQQAQLAQDAGVTAFCYWHYWFGNGKRLLGEIFDEVLASGKPDFPFCLGWANHSWYAKKWDKTTHEDKLLIEQAYPGDKDIRMHFEYLLKAFRDHRYVKIDGKPFLLIFDPFKLPSSYIGAFRELTKQNGFPGLFLVANSSDTSVSKDEFIKLGYDAVTYARLSSLWAEEYSRMNSFTRLTSRIKRIIKQTITGIPRGARDYAKEYHRLITSEDYAPSVIPQIVPQWDHSPRSGDKAAIIYYNTTPKYFAEHVKDALKAIKDKPENRQIIILKSWNEWGEGNYMEPDLDHGRGFIEALRSTLDHFEKEY